MILVAFSFSDSQPTSVEIIHVEIIILNKIRDLKMVRLMEEKIEVF